MILKPFFSFFGSKWRLVSYYPKPKYDTIIEPFAGSAGYSLHYPEKKVILNDRDEKVAELWRYLIHVKESEILSLPSYVEHVDELFHFPKETQNLIAFWINKGCGHPRKSATRWAKEVDINGGMFWSKKCKQRIASQLQYIRHWKIYCGSYKDLYDHIGHPTATWFVDSPYAHDISKEYTYRNINYTHLAEWCTYRNGEVIVCERESADWLPFKHLKDQQGIHQKHTSSEVFYYKENL